MQNNEHEGNLATEISNFIIMLVLNKIKPKFKKTLINESNMIFSPFKDCKGLTF